MYEKYKNKISNFYKTKKRMPVYSEIMNLCNFKSKNAAFKLVQKLIDGGFVKKDKKGRLIPGKIHGELKVLGLVEAGFPSPAEEELADTMSLDEYLIQDRDATYILRVKGDSMIDAGIHDGDMVVVERVPNPKHGQIVIAEVDGEWTIKYLEKRGARIRLIPANKNFKPIIPKNNLRIAAVVKAVIRKY